MADTSLMRAIVVEEDRSMVWAEVSRPRPSAGEVLIKVEATAVNRADLLQRIGRYPPPPGITEVMGLEAAGTIVELGAGVTEWTIGQRVCCLLAGGGYAEFAVCPTAQLLSVPDGMDLLEAAALPEALFTAFLNIYLEGELGPEESVLIHAGASGVGSAALQICRALGNPTYATASASKLPLLRELGAELAMDRQAEDFVALTKEGTEGRGVHVVLDPVGGAYLARNIEVLGPGGRLVVIGLLGGMEGTLPLGLLLRRRLRIVGSVLRARSVAEKRAIRDALATRVWPHVVSGAVRSVVHKALPIQQVKEAHQLLKTNQSSGKVVLTV